MKAITMNTGKQTNPNLNKFIIILILITLSAMDGLAQNKINKGKIDEKIIGNWIIPANGNIITEFAFEMEKNETSLLPLFFQYSFLADGTFTKNIIMLGRYGELPLNEMNYCAKGTWFTNNNQIYLTENCKVSSLTYSITKEKLTIVNQFNTAELTALN